MVAPPLEDGAVNATLALVLPDVAVPMVGAPGTALLLLSPPPPQADRPHAIRAAETVGEDRLRSRLKKVGAIWLMWIFPSCQCVGLGRALKLADRVQRLRGRLRRCESPTKEAAPPQPPGGGGGMPPPPPPVAVPLTQRCT